MISDCLWADDQLLRDVTVTQPLGDQAQHFILAIREFWKRSLSLLWIDVGKEIDQSPGYPGSEHCLAIVYRKEINTILYLKL